MRLGLGRPLPRPRRSAYIRHGPLTGRPFFAGRAMPPVVPRHGLLRAAGRHAPVSNRVRPCSDQAELPCHGSCLRPTGCMHIFSRLSLLFPTSCAAATFSAPGPLPRHALQAGYQPATAGCLHQIGPS